MAHYLVTGGSSGLGEALAIELGRRGHAVGLVARRAEELARVAQAVRTAGGRSEYAVADVTDREATWSAIRQLEEKLGPADCVVANAGGAGAPTLAHKADADKISAIVRLNFDGAINTFTAVLPRMLDQNKGHLAVVSSIAGYRGLPPGAAYSASKAAIQVFMEAWAAELRNTGIAVTTINPGFVATPLNAKAKVKLPFLMQPADAARAMADGLERRRRYVVFPWQMRWLSHLWRPLPWWIFEPVVGRFAPRSFKG